MPSVRVVLKALKPKETEIIPKIFGQHIKRRRLELDLTQRQAAERLGVTPTTVLNWEKGKTEPLIESIPAIVRFLGYMPFPDPRTLPERILALRRATGWSILEAARQLGVDPTTWCDWERGKLILFRKHRTAVAALLGLNQQELADEMRARWSAKHPRL